MQQRARQHPAESPGRTISGSAGERRGAALGVAPEDCGRHAPAGQRARVHLLPGNIILPFKLVFAVSGGHSSPPRQMRGDRGQVVISNGSHVYLVSY